MIGSAVLAELRVLWKRPGTWILLGIWLLMATMFGYVIPYIDRNGDTGSTRINDLLPANVSTNALSGFPFFGGVLILILAVMTFGGDYGWNVIKTLLTQKAGRSQVFASKFAALAMSIIPFVVLDFAISIVASELVARARSESRALESAGTLLLSMLVAWLIMGVWSALGVLLATLTRGTSLAIGIGILYGLVFEGLLSALLDNVDSLSPLIKVLLRTNAYSLVQAIGDIQEIARGNGPGAFSGPYVSGTQALAVLVAYLVIMFGISTYIFRSRDVV